MECSNGPKNANAADSRRSRSDSVGIEMEHAYATGVIIEDEDPLRLPEETTIIPEIKTEIKMEDIEIKQEETESLETEYSPETEYYENMDTSLGNVPFTSSLSVETETETEKYSPFNVGSVPKDVYMELQENYKSTLLRLSHANMLIESLGKKNMALKIEIAKLKKQQRQVDSSINQKSKIFYSDLQKMHEKHTDLQNQLKSLRDENMIYKKRGMTLQDALDIAHEDGDEVTDIYIEPPENNLTDEDSADEDEASPSGNLGARQLSAGAEIVFVNNRRLGGIEADLDPEVLEKEELENIALDQLMEDTSGQFENDPENRKIPLFRIVTEPSYYTFAEEADIEPVKSTFPKEDYSKYQEMSCVELFELFFGNDVLDHIITATRSYSSFRNRPDINVSIAEMKVYIGILLLSGYNNLPSKRSYWENANDMKNVMVSDAMRRDRFLKISRFIHFANFDTIDISDKMYKLRSLTDFLKTKFLDHFVPEQNLSFDESMIRYFGRNGSKQFIRDKPVRLGYKVWCLNAPSGYLVNFEVHQGENPRSNKRFEHLFGKAAAVLVQMIVKMGEKRLFNYNLFFDHLITSTNLLCTLKANGYGATGTIRENRLPQNCPLVSKSQMEKQTRGDFCSTFEKECGILYVRWLDNNVVTMASTCLGTKPVRSVDRYSRKEKNIISISRPNLVLQYNRNACGTDQMNNNISCYRIGIHSQKWYWPIFTYLMDAAVQNAWTLYRKSGRNISQLEFRRNIVQTYLTNFKMPARAVGRMPKAAGSNSRVSNDVRYDGLCHYVIPVPGGKRRRCAGTNCTTSGRTMCSKCDIGLCLSCFKNFHVN